MLNMQGDRSSGYPTGTDEDGGASWCPVFMAGPFTESARQATSQLLCCLLLGVASAYATACCKGSGPPRTQRLLLVFRPHLLALSPPERQVCSGHPTRPCRIHHPCSLRPHFCRLNNAEPRRSSHSNLLTGVCWRVLLAGPPS